MAPRRPWRTLMHHRRFGPKLGRGFDRRQALRIVALGMTAAATPGFGAAFAQDTQDPAKFIAEFAQKGIVEILTANISIADKQSRFQTMFKTDFDIPAIGKFVLGRYVRNVPPADQEAFDGLFQDVIIYTWSRRFSEYNGQTLKVTSTAPDGPDGSIVKSTVIGKGGDSFDVDWRLRKRPEGYKVVDVIVAGVSMAITYRNEYTTIMGQGGGVAALVTQLRTQVADLKKQQG